MRGNSRLDPKTGIQLFNIVMAQTDSDKIDIALTILNAQGWSKMLATFRGLIVANATAERPDIDQLRDFGNRCARLADEFERGGVDDSISTALEIMDVAS